MSSTQEYRLVDASGKIDADNIQRIQEQIKEIKEIINPKEFQCIALNGHIFIENEYDQDAIIIVKKPRKPVDYGIDTYPKHLQEEMHKIQVELKLTKEQVTHIRKSLEQANSKVLELEQQYENLRNTARKVKEDGEKEKLLNNFNKRYSSFHECLSSNLESLDDEAKKEVRSKLDILVLIIEDIKQKHLE